MIQFRNSAPLAFWCFYAATSISFGQTNNAESLSATSQLSSHGDENSNGAAPSSQPSIQPMPDDELLSIGQDVDLGAYISSLNPPSVAEIITSLGPIPTIAEIATPFPANTIALQLYSLGIEDKQEIAALEEQLALRREAWNYPEALKIATHILELRMRLQGPQHWETRDARFTLQDLQFRQTLSPAQQHKLQIADRAAREAQEFYVAAKYDNATILGTLALKYQIDVLGTKHVALAAAQNNLGGYLCSNSEYILARQLYLQALTVNLHTYGDDHPNVAGSLNNLALLLESNGDYRSAETLLIKAIAIYRRTYGNEHAESARCRSNLSVLLKRRFNYVEADLLSGQALSIRRKLFPPGHPDLSESLNNRGAILLDMGAIEDAEKMLREALAGVKKYFGNEHPLVAVSNNNLAFLIQKRGDYSLAETLFRKALEINRAFFGSEHPVVATNLGNLASLLGERGDYAEAETLCRLGLAIHQRVHGDGHPDVANSMSGLAKLLAFKGDYAAASTLCRDALKILRAVYGDDHVEVAFARNNLAMIAFESGDYATAEILFRKALMILDSDGIYNEADVASVLDNFGQLLIVQKKYNEAELLLRRALSIRSRLLGKKSRLTAISLNNLGLTLHSSGDYSAAEKYFREALAIHHEVGGFASSPEVIALCNLGLTFRAQGDNLPAEECFRKALGNAIELRTNVVGGELERAMQAGKLQLAEISNVFADVLIARRDAEAALDALEEGRGRAFLDLLERRKRDLKGELLSGSDKEEANHLSRLLGVVDSQRTRVTTIEMSLAAIERRQDLDKAEKRIQLEQRLIKLKKARLELADANAILLASIRKTWPNAQPQKSRALRVGLAPNEAVLYYSWTFDSILLLVVPAKCAGTVHGFTIARDKAQVQSITDLAAKIQTMLVTATTEMDKSSVGDVRRLLKRLVPAEARSTLAAAKRLVVIPDGPLTGIPLDALATIGDVSILPDIPVVYASSVTSYLNCRQRARNSLTFVHDKQVNPPNLSAIVVGDPIFDRNSPTELAGPNEGALVNLVDPNGSAARVGLKPGDVLMSYDGAPLRSGATSTALDALGRARARVDSAIQAGRRADNERVPVTYWRNGVIVESSLPPGKLGVQLDKASPKYTLQLMRMLSRSDDDKIAEVSALDQVRLFGGKLKPLRGSRREVEAIAQIVRSAGGDVTVLLQEDATIEKLTAAVPGRRILHLATHGLTGSAERPYDASLALTQPEAPSSDDIGFLRLDDLFQTWRGKLVGCELVVLSACDTQRGVKKGDSVMALPWGFFYAGAPTVVASLWEVDDFGAVLLMSRFYENLLGQHDDLRSVGDSKYDPQQPLPKAEALREARMWLRKLSPEEAMKRTEAVVRVGGRLLETIESCIDKDTFPHLSRMGSLAA